MTFNPVKYDSNLYKGADFRFSFRIVRDGTTTDISGWTVTFRASARAGADSLIFDMSTGDSPAYIAVDDENICTITIPAAITATLTQTGAMYYEIDTVNDAAEHDRRVYGTIFIHEDADAA